MPIGACKIELQLTEKWDVFCETQCRNICCIKCMAV